MDRSEALMEALRGLKERISQGEQLNSGFRGPRRFFLFAKVGFQRLLDSFLDCEERSERLSEALRAAACAAKRRRTGRLRHTLREAFRRHGLSALEAFGGPGGPEAMALEDFKALVKQLPMDHKGKKLTEEEAEQIYQEVPVMHRMSFLKVAPRRLLKKKERCLHFKIELKECLKSA